MLINIIMLQKSTDDRGLLLHLLASPKTFWNERGVIREVLKVYGRINIYEKRRCHAASIAWGTATTK
ncbi:hypothetical protein D3C75_802080 [compost metagenome]